MRFVAIDAFGETPTVRHMDEPADIPPGHVLVHIRAAGVNPSDLLTARGIFPPFSVRFPLTLGLDFAGEVERTGPGVTRYAKGDRICGRTRGSYAEYAVVPENETVVPIPDGIDYTEAAALPSAGMTALTCVEAAGIGKGSRVLIVGAAGGVGSFAVQFARARGGYVIATARDVDAAYVRTLGASETIDYTREDAMFPKNLDALLDFASSAPALGLLSTHVRTGGAVISTRSAADVDTLTKRRIRGLNVAHEPTSDLLGRVTKALADREIVAPEIHTFQLEEAADVLLRFDSGHVRGKLVLIP